jgi:hypothetical protein
MTLTAAAPLLAASRPKIAVMPLRAERVGSDVVRILDDLLLIEVGRDDRYEAIGAKEINAFLAAEGMKDMLGCDEVTCASEIGGALDASFTLSGTVGKLGDKFVISVTLFDNQSLKAVERQATTIPADENLFEHAIATVVAKMFGRPAPPPPAVGRTRARQSSQGGSVAAGVLQLTTKPEGTAVFANGKYVGRTPVAVSITPGAYDLELKKEEHALVRKSVRIESGTASTFGPYEMMTLAEARSKRKLRMGLKYGGMGASALAGVVFSYLTYREVAAAREADTEPSGIKLTIYVTLGIAGFVGVYSLSSVPVPPPPEEPGPIPTVALAPTDGGAIAGALWSF